jgi:hypothetical protein
LSLEPLLEDRDGILWIKELAKEFPDTRILIVSRQSERVYAKRGAARRGHRLFDKERFGQGVNSGLFLPRSDPREMPSTSVRDLTTSASDFFLFLLTFFARFVVMADMEIHDCYGDLRLSAVQPQDL